MYDQKTLSISTHWFPFLSFPFIIFIPPFPPWLFSPLACANNSSKWQTLFGNIKPYWLQTHWQLNKGLLMEIYKNFCQCIILDLISPLKHWTKGNIKKSKKTYWQHSDKLQTFYLSWTKSFIVDWSISKRQHIMLKGRNVGNM